MYADDTTLAVTGTDVKDISSKLTSDLHEITNWLHTNKLFINTEKTNVMLLGTGSRLRNVNEKDFCVVVNDHELKRVNKAKCIGVQIDEELKWHTQVNSVTQKIFLKLALIRRLKPFLDISTLNLLCKSMVLPVFDYYNIVWYGRFNDDIKRLDVLHKRCARVILGVNCYTSSDFMFKTLGWERLNTRSNYFKSLMMYKSLNGHAPHYLATNFKYVSDNS